jgi:hypothetical protein
MNLTPFIAMSNVEITNDGTARREEFRVSKHLETKGSKSLFIRAADSAKAKRFIELISEREKLATIRFGNIAEVVVGKLDGDRLIYPFVSNPTLENEIRTALDSENFITAHNLISEYIFLISSLPKDDCIPREFFKFLKYVPPSLEGKMCCIEFAPIDCIPRNLVRRGGKWKVLDLEWTFEFPLPVEFLIWRGMTSLLSGLQATIQKHTSSRFPVTLYRGFGKNRIYLPLDWFSFFPFETDIACLFREWELLFQNQILEVPKRKTFPNRISSRKKIYTQIPGDESFVIRIEEVPRSLLKTVRTASKVFESFIE